MNKKKIFFIDGSAYLYRAFHAIRNLSNSKGLPTNATFGFTRMLLKLIKEENPEYIALFFDVKGPTFRHQMYDQYKANRPPMPEEMAQQIPYIKQMITAFGIPIVEKQGFEADDLIGTCARLAEESGFSTVMVTGDKDFMQLVTDHCVIYDPMKDKTIDKATIQAEFNLTPAQIIDMLGLAGDTADNIPGVPGVGPKTAMKLLEAHGSVQGIYDHLDELKGKKALHKKLSDNREQAFLSLRLVTIDKHVEIPFQIEAFKAVAPDNDALSSLFQELEFRQLQKEFTPEPEPMEKTYVCLTDLKKIKQQLNRLKKADIFAIDTETTSKHPMRAELVGISFAHEPHKAYYIPVGHVAFGNEKFEQPDRQAVLDLIKPILEDAAIPKVGQNIKYDYIVLSRCGISMQGMVFDTMIASHLLNPSHRGHSLDQIALDLLGHKTIKYEEMVGKGKNRITFNEVEIEKAVDYAAEDADITLLAYHILEKRIRENGLNALMKEIEIPLVPVLARMEMNGIRVDTEKLSDLSQSFEQEMFIIEEEIFSLAGERFNVNSSQQLGTILFEKLKLPTQKKTKKKTGYSTDIDVLTKLAQSHELPALILRYRSLGKLKSTYTDALQLLVHPKTHRIHTSFNQSITATGRLSSSEPNLQNIPIRTPEGKEIRASFIPEKGQVLVAADYSQIELRILAHCAEDAILIDAFTHDEDIHTRTAAEVFNTLPGFITPELRRQAKAINFGIVYGMGAFKLGKELEISRKMAQTYIDNYFERYAGVKTYIDTTIATARETGEVVTLLGRKRRLDDINAANANMRGFAERMAINTPIQGSAADLIKLAMIRMEKALTEKNMASRMLLSVHDEILFEVPEKELEALMSLAKEVMENVFELKVPLKVNIDAGSNWAEAH
ncbi:MAG: DNA polymerase I [Desulfobacterium sp.]